MSTTEIANIPYNGDSLIDKDFIVIVPNIDNAATLYELGITNVTAMSHIEEANYEYYEDKKVLLIPECTGLDLLLDYAQKLYDMEWNCEIYILEDFKRFYARHLIEVISNEKYIRSDHFEKLYMCYASRFPTSPQKQVIKQTFQEFILDYQKYPEHIWQKEQRNYIRIIAHTMSVPFDWVAGAVMAVSSSLMGSKVKLDMGGGAWKARALYNYCVAALSGTNKSNPIKLVVDYIYRKDSECNNDYMKKTKEYNKKMLAFKRDKLEETPEAPTRRRYFVDDITIEQIGYVLQDNPQGLLWYTDEMSQLLDSLNQYKGGKGNDGPKLIGINDGKTMCVIRGGKEYYIESPFANFLGTAQIDVIRKALMIHKSNGLADRFNFTYSPNVEYKFIKNPESIPNLDNFFDKLNNLTQTDKLFTLSDEAFDVLERNMNDVSIWQNTKDNYIRGIISKVRTVYANLCLIIHIINNIDNLNFVIQKETVEQAYELALYHLCHNYLALNHSADDDIILSKIKKWTIKKELDSMPIRQMVVNKYFKNKTDALEYLKELEKKDKGYLINDKNFKPAA